MNRTISTSPFGSVPVVVFQRLHVETNEPISLHTIIFESAAEARAKAAWIKRQPHLALIGTADATFCDSPAATAQAEETPPPAVSDSAYSARLREIHARIAAALGDEKPVVFYSAYKSDEHRLPIDNLDSIAIEGKVKFLAPADDFWGDGKAYESEVVESPTWLTVAVLANAMIRTTCDYHHQFLETVYAVTEESGVTIAHFGMGS